MSLSEMATEIYTFKRNLALVAGKGGGSVAHLTNIASTPIMPAVTGDGNNNPLIITDPIKGQITDLHQIYVEYQTHEDMTVEVTQLPDIEEGDVLVADSADYRVRRVEKWPATSDLLSYMRVTVEESI